MSARAISMRDIDETGAIARRIVNEAEDREEAEPWTF
jgi:hypothetical protein